MKALLALEYSEIYRAKSLKELGDKCEIVGRKCSQATGQLATSCDCMVSDITTKQILLEFLVMPDKISFWNWRNRFFIQDIEGVPAEAELRYLLENVKRGLNKCNECGKWLPDAEVKSYSYAGCVCKGCYNPKRHTQPSSH